jgi:iron complex outermembrane receptor protein
MKAFALCLLLLAVSVSGYAQVKEKDSVTYLEEVILLDPAKKPMATGITASSIIGPEVFQNYSPVDLPASLNQISGVYVLSGALNTNRITIRGVGARTAFGTDKLRLYFNNIPVTNGTGSSTLEAFDLENLFTMEVIKGPKGSSFGANLGGAIMLQTKAPSPGVTAVSNSFNLGSYGLLKDNLGLSINEGALDLELHYNHLEQDGYRENSFFNRNAVLLNTSLELHEKSSLGLLVNHINYTAQIPSSLGTTAFKEDPRQAAFTWAQAKGYEDNAYTLLGINHNLILGPQLTNNTSIFYSYLDHYEPRPFNILDEFTNSYGFRSIFEGTLKAFGAGAEYSLGAEFYKDEYHWGTYENLYEQNNGAGSLEGDALSNNVEFRRQFFAFGTFKIDISEAFTAQFGLTLNSTSYDFRDHFNSGPDNLSASRSFDAILMPSLDLEYRINKHYQLYANVSRGFSNPSLEETLTPDGVINPGIEQETGVSYELGNRLIFDAFTITASLYRMNIKNLLVAERVGQDQYIGRNAGSTRHSGLEIDGNLIIELGSKTSLAPFVSYSYSDHQFVRFVDGENDYSGNPLTGVPKHRLNTGWRLEYARAFYWTLAAQYVSGMPLTDANTLYSDDFTILNSRVGFQKKFGKKMTLGLNAGINNIFDSRYAASVLINAVAFGNTEPRYFYPGNGFNAYGGIEMRYEW